MIYTRHQELYLLYNVCFLEMPNVPHTRYPSFRRIEHKYSAMNFKSSWPPAGPNDRLHTYRDIYKAIMFFFQVLDEKKH